VLAGAPKAIGGCLHGLPAHSSVDFFTMIFIWTDMAAPRRLCESSISPWHTVHMPPFAVKPRPEAHPGGPDERVFAQ
jgi:hypothetical protein